MTDLHALSAEELRERVITVGGGRLALPAFEELYRRAAALEAAEHRLADLAETAQVVVTEHEQENPFVGYSIDALKAALAALQEGEKP